MFNGLCRYYPIQFSTSSPTRAVKPQWSGTWSGNSNISCGPTVHAETQPPSLCCFQGPEGSLPPPAAARLAAVRPAAPQRPAGHHHPDPQVPPHSTQRVSALMSHLHIGISLKGVVRTIEPLLVTDCLCLFDRKVCLRSNLSFSSHSLNVRTSSSVSSLKYLTIHNYLNRLIDYN